VTLLIFTDDAAEMAPNREMDAVAMPTRRPLNGAAAAARQDEVVVTWNAGCWADWQLPILVVLFAGLGVLAVVFVVNIAISTTVNAYYHGVFAYIITNMRYECTAETKCHIYETKRIIISCQSFSLLNLYASASSVTKIENSV